MSKIDFNNTEIAFAHKSNQSLKKASLLFKSFNYPFLVQKGPSIASFLLSIKAPIKSLIRSTIFEQFCGGETIQECSKTIKQLSDSHIGTILDYSVEGEENEVNFVSTFNEIKNTIDMASNNPNIPFSVFKTTGIGRFALLEKISSNKELNALEREEFDRFKKRFFDLCEHAFKKNVRLFVDAEETWIQSAIDELTYEMMSLFNTEKAIIYNTIQCYRTNRLNHVMEISERLNCYIGYKLVRGAYMEKERERAQLMGYPSPIQKDKISTDNEYNSVLEYCVKNNHKIAICAGTHNEDSCLYLSELQNNYGLENNNHKIYYAQLLGMSDHISFNLSKLGYNVAKYVPYGPVKSVLPYLGRRAKENSSVKGQAGRELALINKELNRRKLN